jgi:hypothetical protein
LQLHPVKPKPFALAELSIFGLAKRDSNFGREPYDQRLTMIMVIEFSLAIWHKKAPSS